jgi:hypothetical protein
MLDRSSSSSSSKTGTIVDEHEEEDEKSDESGVDERAGFFSLREAGRLLARI